MISTAAFPHALRHTNTEVDALFESSCASVGEPTQSLGVSVEGLSGPNFDSVASCFYLYFCSFLSLQLGCNADGQTAALSHVLRNTHTQVDALFLELLHKRT